MLPAYDIHPEFGYFCPAPRARRELRVAVVSILAGMAIGAAIVAIHAGQAAETEAVSGNAQHENARWQDRRGPYWGERAYAEDRYWRGAYRNWVYR